MHEELRNAAWKNPEQITSSEFETQQQPLSLIPTEVKNDAVRQEIRNTLKGIVDCDTFDRHF